MTTTPATDTDHCPVLGVDVGGTGIKAGLVDVGTGDLIGDRHYLDTPQPATPDAVAETIARVVADLDHRGPIGVALPSVIHEGTARVAPNIDSAWIGCEVGPLFERHLPGQPVAVLNDADAAGLTEVLFGAARGRKGLVILLTFGTGIGSALLVDGRLLPNSEFGHVLVRVVDGQTVDEAELLASAAVRARNEWSFREWTPHVSTVLRTIEDLLWPSVFVIGGGISENADTWFPMLDNRTPVVAATKLNDAGLVGAAVFAASESGRVDISGVLASRSD